MLLLGFTLVAVPLGSFELHVALTGREVDAGRWIDVAKRCQTAIEQGTDFDATGLQSVDVATLDYFESSSMQSPVRAWRDSQAGLTVTEVAAVPAGKLGEVHSCTIRTAGGVPVSKGRAADLWLAFSQWKQAMLLNGYADRTLDLVPPLLTAAFDAQASNRAGCRVRTVLFVTPADDSQPFLSVAEIGVDAPACGSGGVGVSPQPSRS